MFKIIKKSKFARTGELKTAHGIFNTPFFMPVATNASVKTLESSELDLIGTDVVISNSFILSLKPGLEIISKHKGLHKFMNWNKGIFTDSGGFQILDDFFRQKVSDRGVVFKNPFTGQNVLFTPEDSMRIQLELASDVAMALDDVPKTSANKDYVLKSVKRTFDWAKRCFNEHKKLRKKNKSKQLLFGICQGGHFEDIRQKSAKEISGLDFDGLAIGGLCIGETKEEMHRALDASLKEIDRKKPIYFMGLGSPDDILLSVSKGVDIFDSIYPSRNARRGSLFTKNGQIKIKSKKYRDDLGPIEDGCNCFTCRNYSKAFVSHQLFQNETLGLRLATIHNIYFMQKLMADIRKSILAGVFEEFKQDFLKNYKVPKRNSSGFWEINETK